MNNGNYHSLPSGGMVSKPQAARTEGARVYKRKAFVLRRVHLRLNHLSNAEERKQQNENPPHTLG